MLAKAKDFFTDIFNPHATLAATLTAITTMLLAFATSVVAIGRNGVDGIIHGDPATRIWLASLLLLNILSTIRAGAGRGFAMTMVKPPTEPEMLQPK